MVVTACTESEVNSNFDKCREEFKYFRCKIVKNGSVKETTDKISRKISPLSCIHSGNGKCLRRKHMLVD
jgi:hypothetical protein